MTANELISHFNNTYGMHTSWPKTYSIDIETYGNCCQAVFNWFIENKEIYKLGKEGIGQYYEIKLPIGIHGGLLFKNVELIISSDK